MVPTSFRFLTAFGVVVGVALSANAADRRPNVIVLLADDLGYADLSLQGNSEVATPHIDSIAVSGVRCTSGYVSSPVCSPSRAGLLTGRYQERFGHEFNPAFLQYGGQGQGLPTDERTIADRLRVAGYATAAIGKWHLGEEDQFHPLNRGFDEFFGFLTGAHTYLGSDDRSMGPICRNRQRVELDGYLTDVLGREACDFIDRHREQPFFLYLAFNAVHTPLEAPPSASATLSQISDPERRTYLQMLASLDDTVGAVLAKLRESKLEEETLVFFLSDNGGPTTKFSANASRNTPLRGSKGDTWEGGIHVPMFVQWKGRLQAGVAYSRPVVALDLAATALTAAGVEPPTNPALDGVNLLPYFDGQHDDDPHEFLYWKFGRQMAVRSGDWKLVRPSMGSKEFEDIAVEPLLFNLKDDLGEQHDLATQHPGQVARLQAAWDRWRNELPPPRWPCTLKGQALTFEP